MKKYVVRTVSIAALLVSGFAASAAAQTDPIVGGYGPVSVKNPEVKKAAAVAVSDHRKKDLHSATLVRIVKAEQQV
ncbi:MAG TPA: hypothetical protein VL501_07425, partial [Pyrinomonadaceae bacterium]|nr:hypothetical protein [Pyrinomonadaceae bacterium]